MVADLGLGGRGVDRFRQLLGFLQSFRQFDATDGAVLLITCPAASCDVTTDDTFYREHLQLLAHHALSSELLLLEEFRHVLCIHRDHVVRHNVFCVIKPELGHLGQHGAFVRDLVLQNNIKCGNPVGGAEIRSVATMIRLSPLS